MGMHIIGKMPKYYENDDALVMALNHNNQKSIIANIALPTDAEAETSRKPSAPARSWTAERTRLENAAVRHEDRTRKRWYRS